MIFMHDELEGFFNGQRTCLHSLLTWKVNVYATTLKFV